MALKLLRRGNVWYLRGTVRGIHIYESTKVSDESVAEEIRTVAENRLLQESIYGQQATKTFGDAASAYLAWGGSDRFLSPLTSRFGSTTLGTITQADLDSIARKLLPNASPQTRSRQVYTPFIAVWNYASKVGWATTKQWLRPRTPMGTNVVRLKSDRSGQKPVAYERAAKFVAAMSPAPAMLMTALFYTGMRPIEALALAGPDVDLADRWLVVRNSKIGEPRGVPLHSFLCEWLAPLVERAQTDGGKVFRTSRCEPYKEVQNGGGGLKSAIQGARRRSGILDISPYTCRHTVSTSLVIAGVHQHVKDQILGHAVTDMSRHYTHVPQAPLIEAIDKLPVPALWRAQPWAADPAKWWSRLVEGTGKRTDLIRS